MGFFNLGKGWTPLEYVMVIKCLDPEGEVRYRELTSKSLTPTEALGMVVSMGDTLRNRLMRNAHNFREES